MKKGIIIFLILSFVCFCGFTCSTVKVLNADKVVTARTMDFFREMYTQISIVPKGTKYNFGVTKYNFVAITAFNIPAHAVNEKGLSGAMLWLNDTKYPEKFDKTKKVINVLEYLTFVIGNYKTVKEVVGFFKDYDIDFVNIPEEMKKLDLLHQHAYFVDAGGNTLILEWLNGKLKIYENESPALVNDPDFDMQKLIWANQLKTNEDIINWEYNMIGKKMHSADTRYQLLRRLTEQSLQTTGIDTITKAFGILERVTYMKIKPYIPDMNEVSWTLYTVVIEQTEDNVKMFYKDDLNPSIRMINLKTLDWKPKKFDIELGEKYVDFNNIVNMLK